MAELSYLETETGRKIAYHYTKGRAPGIVFLGGFKSDMEGSKALFLEAWAKEAGHAFLRFDYSGHGQSSGEFIDGCIGEWAADAMAAIAQLTTGPQILVGSSMGGWIGLLVAKAMPQNVAGFIGIAAAPDFTQDSMWEGMNEEQRQDLKEHGVIYLPSDYDEPYAITHKLIEDGRDHLVLREPLNLAMPIRLLHGTADTDVTMQVPLRLVEHATADDLELTFVKDADHRFSDERCLGLIAQTLQLMINKIEAGAK